MNVLQSSKVRVAMSKFLKVCSRDGVPQAYTALKKWKLQQMRKQRLMEQPTVVTPERSATIKQVWRLK
jgi:hypothetical protein